MSDWLQSLKVGDEVAVKVPLRTLARALGPVHRMTVTHCTERFIECGPVRFRRKDGCEVKCQPNNKSKFHEILNDWNVYSDYHERSAIEKRLREEFFGLGALGMKRPLDQLRRIVAILDEPKSEADK